MCGITGLFSHGAGFWPMEAKIFTDMVYVGALRGTHGTGIFGVSDDSSRFQSKIGAPPDQLFGSKDFDKFVSFVEKKNVIALVGHNRLATTGKRTTANAHPFRHGSITMVHNGTINSWGKFKKEAAKFEVDSEAVCWLIDKYGIPEVVSTITGAWAIVGWNSKTEELFMFKNKERPLYLSYRAIGKLWMFASEKGMLDWIGDRSFAVWVPAQPIENNVLYTFKSGNEHPTKKLLETTVDKAIREFKELEREEAYDSGREFARNSSVGATDINLVQRVVEKTSFHALEYPIVLNNSNWAGSGMKSGQCRVPTPAKKSPMKESWVIVKNLKDLFVGKTMDLELVDYDKVKDTHQGFQVVMMDEKYPDIRFIGNVAGDKEMGDLVEATRMTGTILNIQKSNNNPAVSSHRIVLHNLQPVFDTIIIPNDADIPSAAFLMDGSEDTKDTERNEHHAG